jgi:hypothetical protein
MARGGKVIDRLFGLTAHRTDVRTEVVAGITTFLAMAYIIFVQPAVLSAAGMDFGAVMVATCLASALATLLMGLLANYPIAVAPAMGHNFYFAFTVCVAHRGNRVRVHLLRGAEARYRQAARGASPGLPVRGTLRCEIRLALTLSLAVLYDSPDERLRESRAVDPGRRAVADPRGRRRETAIDPGSPSS